MDRDEHKRAAPDHPVQELISRRWSPYAFSEKPVPRETLASLFEAARWAPSSYNEQPWSYIVATREEPEEFARLLGCLVEANQQWARSAPVLALGVVRRTFTRNGKPNAAAEHDLGLAAGNLLAEATARGLYVHQMIGIAPEKARETYAIPEHSAALTAIAIGHLGDAGALDERRRALDEAARTRRPLAEFVFSGAWGRPAKLSG